MDFYSAEAGQGAQSPPLPRTPSRLKPGSNLIHKEIPEHA